MPQPANDRSASVRKNFQPLSLRGGAAVPIANISQLNIHSPNILWLDAQRNKGETKNTPDNRAGRSGQAETGNLSGAVTKVHPAEGPSDIYPVSNLRHTVGHIRCPACESARSRTVRSVIDPKLDFSTAAKKWLEWHSAHVGARTIRDYTEYVETLKLFDLGPTPLTEIHPGHFEQYQVWRKRSPKRGAGNPRINQELNCLKQILEQAGLWDAIKPFYKQLPMPKWKPPRVMTPEKEDEVLQIAASKSSWEVAHCCLVITDNTGIGPGELRAMLVDHLHLERNVVDVAAGELGDKNEFRIAPMALNEPARAAFEVLLARYFEVLGKQGIEYSSQHFLLPFRVKKGTYDPTQQASPSFIRSALREIRAEAGLPKLRHYDFRHQLITTLLEIPEVSEETVKAIARHKVGERTIEHYSAVRIHKKQNAVDILNDRRRFAAMRRPPQRESSGAAPIASTSGFPRNQSYPQG